MDFILSEHAYCMTLERLCMLTDEAPVISSQFVDRFPTLPSVNCILSVRWIINQSCNVVMERSC